MLASWISPGGARPDRDRTADERTARLKASRKLETDAHRQKEHAAHDVEAADKRGDRAADILREAEETLADARRSLGVELALANSGVGPDADQVSFGI